MGEGQKRVQGCVREVLPGVLLTSYEQVGGQIQGMEEVGLPLAEEPQQLRRHHGQDGEDLRRRACSARGAGLLEVLAREVGPHQAHGGGVGLETGVIEIAMKLKRSCDLSCLDNFADLPVPTTT